MPERLFVFIQAELPFRLALGDGRYVVRERAGTEPDHVLVVRTLGRGPARAPRGFLRRRARGSAHARRGREVAAEPAAASSPTARATVIDAVSLSAERQTQAWLDAIDAEKEIRAAFAVVNRALFAQRIATADSAVQAIAPVQALAIRAGWGLGEEVADGRWTHARELHWVDPGPRGRVAALRPQERFAALLGARTEALLCEELALRAREDLAHGHTRLAALELDHAYAAALSELRSAARAPTASPGKPATLADRLVELAELRDGVAELAAVALDPAAGDRGGAVDREVLEHALARLEATLRARAAAP
jgi:hypothetical protein